MNTWSAVLYNSIKRGNKGLWNITDRIKATWRRSIRDVGGYWIGTCDYLGSRDELLEMFLEGMGREVREDSGGMLTWQGYVAEMEIQLDGVRYARSMVNLANAVKVIYSRVGDNLLSNGGSESGVWETIAPATVEQATDWINTGSYSGKITVGTSGKSGARVGSATITAGVAYTLTGILKVVSGAWRVLIKRSDTLANIAEGQTHNTAGEVSISINIQSSNTYSGTVYIDIKTYDSLGVAYGDSFCLQLAPVKAETGWTVDADSASEYGRMELALLEAGMTSAAANAKAITTRRKQAWVKTLPPSEFTLIGADLDSDPLDTSGTRSGDKLTLTVHGYCHTLSNKYTLAAGTAAASAHVATILGEAEFVTAGGIAANTLSYQIDNRAPIRHWQILSDIIKSGDASGNRWVGGVYAWRYFHYGQAENDIAYRYRQGKVYLPAGGEQEPWFAEPGHLLYLDDAPVGPGQLSGVLEDDPHYVYVSEVEMGPATEAYPMGTLTMRHEELA